jgi:hypothetical protein
MLRYKRWAKGRDGDKREQELREALLKQVQNGRTSEVEKSAIAYCQYFIVANENWFDWNEAKWLLCQRIVIIGGVIATLAGVITLPGNWLASIPELQSFSWLRGVPAAIVTIAASYLSSFTFREDAVRHELTAYALWNELAKYVAHAKPYNNTYNNTDGTADTSAFLNAVCQIVEAELHGWKSLVIGKTGDESETDDKGKPDDKGKTEGERKPEDKRKTEDEHSAVPPVGPPAQA